MADTQFKLDFKGNTYAKCRPSYSDKVFSLIYDFHQADFDLCIDVGTGTGKVAAILSKKFKQVIGIDYLPEMIESAIKRKNITYKVGKGEDLSALEDNSVDLITSAASFHWLDQDTFLKEAKRVLKPSGTLAVFSYCYPLIKNSDEASKLVKAGIHKLHVHQTDERLKCVANFYRDVNFPFDDQKWYITPKNLDTTNISQPLDSPLMQARMPVHNLMDLIKTYSVYINFSKSMKDSDIDPIDDMEKDIVRVMDSKDNNPTLQLEWPFVLILCRNT